MENNKENTVSNAVDTTVNNTEGTTPKNENVATETKEKTEKTFTQEELDKILNKRFAKLKSDFEAEKTEAEKLAKMSAEEKAKHEFEKEKQKFEEERQAYLKEKLELQVTKELSQKSLPVEFSKYLIGSNAEECLENIKEFEQVFQQAVEKAIQSKLVGNTPKSVAAAAKVTTVTKEEFKKLGFMAKQKFAEENPDLYKEFIK